MMWSAQWAVEQLVGSGTVGPEQLGESLFKTLFQKHKDREEKQAAKALKKRKARATDDGQQAVTVKSAAWDDNAPPVTPEFTWISDTTSQDLPLPQEDPLPKSDPELPAAFAADLASDNPSSEDTGPRCKVCGTSMRSDQVKWVNKKAFCLQCSTSRE